MATNRSKKTKELADSAREFVTLAHKFILGKHDISGWYMSEKLDGVRARLVGGKLVSRYQKVFPAPEGILKRIIKEIGDIPVDGELYAGRGNFQKTVSIVKNSNFKEKDWLGNIQYQIFDVVDTEKNYKDRVMELLADMPVEDDTRITQFVPVHKIKDTDHMEQMLEQVILENGEGLILRNPDSPYIFGRTNNLLKVKPVDDMEVEIIDHEEGDGRNEKRLGALICKLDNGRIVRVGSGLTDQLRENPPSIGNKITIAYMGLTDSGIPRHPIYKGIRNYE